MDSQENEGPIEIAFVGDLTDSASDLHEKLIGTPHGGECLIYFDSPGGSPYSAISLMNLILIRDLSATAVVTGECSSAALWPFAACQRRIVTPPSKLGGGVRTTELFARQSRSHVLRSCALAPTELGSQVSLSWVDQLSESGVGELRSP